MDGSSNISLLLMFLMALAFFLSILNNDGFCCEAVERFKSVRSYVISELFVMSLRYRVA